MPFLTCDNKGYHGNGHHHTCPLPLMIPFQICPPGKSGRRMSQGNMLNFLDSARVYMDSALQKPGTTLTRTVNLRRFLQRNILKRSSPMKLNHTGPLRQCRRRKSSASKASTVLTKTAETSDTSTAPSDGQTISQCLVSKMPNSGTDSSIVYIDCSSEGENVTSHSIRSSRQVKAPVRFSQPDSYVKMADPAECPFQHQAQNDLYPLDPISFQIPPLTGWNLPAHAIAQQPELGSLTMVHDAAADICHTQLPCNQDDMLNINRQEDLGKSAKDILYNSMLYSGLTLRLPEPDVLCGSDVDVDKQVVCGQHYETPRVPPVDTMLCASEPPLQLENQTSVCSQTVPKINPSTHELSDDSELSGFLDMTISSVYNISDSGQVETANCQSFSNCGSSFITDSSAMVNVQDIQPASPLQHEFSFINAFLGLDAALPEIQNMETTNVNYAVSLQNESLQHINTFNVNCAESLQGEFSESASTMNVNGAVSLQNESTKSVNRLDVNYAVNLQDKSPDNTGAPNVNCAVCSQSRSPGRIDTLNANCAVSVHTLIPTRSCEENSHVTEMSAGKQNNDDSYDECLQQLFTAIEIMSSTEANRSVSDFDSFVGNLEDNLDVVSSTSYLCGDFSDTVIPSSSPSPSGAVYCHDQQAMVVSHCTPADNGPVHLERSFSPTTLFSFPSSTAETVDHSSSVLSTDIPLASDGTNCQSNVTNALTSANFRDGDLNMLLHTKNSDNCILSRDLAKGFSLDGEINPQCSFGISDVLLTLAQEESDHLESIQQETYVSTASAFGNCDDILTEFLPNPVTDLDSGHVNGTSVSVVDHSEYFPYLEGMGNSFSTIDEISNSLSPSTDLIPATDDQFGDIFCMQSDASGSLAADLNWKTTTSVPKTEQGVQTSGAKESDNLSFINGEHEQDVSNSGNTNKEISTNELDEKSLFSDSNSDFEESQESVLSECLYEDLTGNETCSFSNEESKCKDSLGVNIPAFRIHPYVINDDGNSTDDDTETEWNQTLCKLPPFHLVFLTNVNRLYRNMGLANPVCDELE